MDIDRCPSCAAAVRKGTHWCTLCYADLRPVPAIAERARYPKPHASPVQAPASAGDGLLFAPYEQVPAAADGGGAHSAPPANADIPQVPAQPAAGWPCTRCGTLNPFDTEVCGSCASLFGAELSSPLPVVNRGTLLVRGILAALVFVMLVGVLSFCGTDVSDQPSPSETVGEIVTRPGADPADDAGRPTTEPTEPGADANADLDKDADAAPDDDQAPGPRVTLSADPEADPDGDAP